MTIALGCFVWGFALWMLVTCLHITIDFYLHMTCFSSCPWMFVYSVKFNQMLVIYIVCGWLLTYYTLNNIFSEMICNII